MLRSREPTLTEQTMLGSGDLEFHADGRAPCVVAIHGFGGTASELRPLLDGVAGAGFAVDAALLPGHGSRVEALQDENFDDWVDASRLRLGEAQRKYGRTVLLGFSLGSLVAMQIASERPTGLTGLVVLGNALRLQPHSSVPFAIWERLGWRMPDVYIGKPRAADLMDRSLLPSIVTYDRHPLRAALEVFRAGPRVREVVGAIQCPTLVLHGKRDKVCPWQNATWMAEHVGARDVSVRIFARSAHVLACDAERGEVAREVLAFLARIA